MAGPVKVDFFLGIASRYSYLASTQITRLEADTGCQVLWRPLFTGDLMRLRGTSPFRGEAPSGQYNWSYRQYDAECWAEYYGVPYSEPPGHLIHDYDALGRLALAATAAERLDAAAAYCRRIYTAVFTAPPDRVDDRLLLSFAGDCGCDQDEFKAMLADPATAEQLRAKTREAHDRGVFGVPAFLVDDRMYWGNDRLELLRHYLANRQKH